MGDAPHACWPAEPHTSSNAPALLKAFLGQIIYRPSLQFTTVTSALVIFTKGTRFFFFLFFPPSIVIHHNPPHTHTTPGSKGFVGAGRTNIWCGALSNYACIVFRATNHRRILYYNRQCCRSSLGFFTFISSTSHSPQPEPLDPPASGVGGRYEGL